MEQDFLKELRSELVQELTQNLGDWEETILTLDRTLDSNEADSESRAARAEAIAQAFRIAHSIKGSCAALGLTNVAEFGHAVEDGLSILRNHNQLVSPDVISTLLKAGDEFKRAVEAIGACRENQWSAGELLGTVRNMTETLNIRLGNGVPAAPVEAMNASGHFEIEAVASPAVPEPLENHGEEHLAVQSTTPPVSKPSVRPTTGESPRNSEGATTQKTAESIRMDPARLETLLDLVGELVVIKSQILMEFGERSRADLKSSALLTLFDRTVRDLQDRALGMRMTSLKPLFMRIRRVVRDTADKVGKPADIDVGGEDMEIDRSMIELLADPLMHLVRNSLDHGIESPADRAFTGKSQQARLQMKAERRGGRLELSVSDDGRGIHREKVLARAREKGLVPDGVQDERLTDAEVFDYLFMPGFSTAEKVTDISGRGVGLDVVRSNVQKLKGTITVRSTRGQGTEFRLSLPLTTAITDGIIVQSRGVRMVIPLEGVREFVCQGEDSRCSIDPQTDAVRIRDEVLPLLNLAALFPIAHHVGASTTALKDSDEGRNRKCGSLVVVDCMGESCAIEIDGILGQAQVVTKPLPGVVAFESGVSGTAVMGDGVIALVLDVSSLPRSLLNPVQGGLVSQQESEVSVAA